MVNQENIKSLVGNHVSPYIYNSKEFTPGKTPIYYSGPYWDNREAEAAIEAIPITRKTKRKRGPINLAAFVFVLFVFFEMLWELLLLLLLLFSLSMPI
jgi:hypothetical protein